MGRGIAVVTVLTLYVVCIHSILKAEAVARPRILNQDGAVVVEAADGHNLILREGAGGDILLDGQIAKAAFNALPNNGALVGTNGDVSLIRALKELSKRVLPCGPSQYRYMSNCLDIPTEGCAGGRPQMALSPGMVACPRACSRTTPISHTNLGLWNKYWNAACDVSSGWTLCFGAEVVDANGECEGNWNGTYAVFAQTTANYNGQCGGGAVTAYTTTVNGRPCRGRYSNTGLYYNEGPFDGIHGGFVYLNDNQPNDVKAWGGPLGAVAGTCHRYGAALPSFTVHSPTLANACEADFCNTCAAPSATGALCCKRLK